MSRSKLFNMIKTRGTQVNSRNPFDLSNAHAYSQKAGTITPIKAIHVIPKDFLNISVRDFTQTLPMMSAPFLKAKKEISAYFVPYNSLWHNFNQYQSTREDPQSSLLQDRGIVYEPRMALYDMYGVPYYSFLYFVLLEYAVRPFIHFGGFFDERLDQLVDQVKRAFDSSYLALMNDGSDQFYQPFYGIDAHVDNIDLSDMVKGIFAGVSDPLPEVLMPYNWYLNENQKPNRVPTLGFYADGRRSYKETFKDLVGNYNWCDMLRKLDMLGYGNIYPYFKSALSEIESAYNDWYVHQGGDNYYQELLAVIRRNFRGLKIDLATICSSTAVTFETGEEGEGIVRGNNVFISPLPLFAYNKIFYDYFRNTYYDDKYHVRNYNVDFIFSDRLDGSIVSSHLVPSRFWMLETHQYKKDMFTAVMPSTQFGAVSVLPIFSDSDVISINSTYTSSGGSPIAGTNASFNNQGNLVDALGNNAVHTHSFSASASLNPLELKRVEALQQYRQDLLRAGNRTEDIFKQIYGSEPKSQLSEKPYFIDAVSNDFNINPVISTADTQQGVNGSLGDIASRAISSGNGLNAKFSTEDFGVVLVLCYVVPESMYNSTLIDAHLTNLSPEEHFIPHFQNLGFEPLYRMYLNNLKTPDVRNNVVGFTLPYLELKTDFDLAHGAFACVAAYSKYDRTIVESFRGSLSHWVVARTDMQSQDVTELSAFYINPSILDSVFVQESGADYESDQFICYTQIECPAVRQISELGLPNFL